MEQTEVIVKVKELPYILSCIGIATIVKSSQENVTEYVALPLWEP
jgi:hypothetical protein